ncbi:hypothetical protein ACHAXR_004929 [Thalassiosira sp. AJA248-18]
MNSNAEEAEYNDDAYVRTASSFCKVPGLFSNFLSSAVLLHMARSELRVELVEDGTDVVEEFYHLLDRVHAYMEKKPSPSSDGSRRPSSKKFIIEVEGLDGSGKTTLVKKLEEALPNAIATKTPSTALKNIRPLWDHRGGILARAFYMVSNYVLEYEIANDAQHEIIIVDRWYASTCAYTVGYQKKNRIDDDNNNDEEKEQTTTTIDISNLPEEIFDWPKDLQLRPQILLVLQIDPKVRQKRVEHRASSGSGGASRFNPWDDRLARDLGLGTRILNSFNRIRGPHEIHSVNANLSIEEVVDQALDIVKPAMKKYLHPQGHFSSQPLAWWKFMSQQLCLCDDSGKRAHHALWNLQVSYNIDEQAAPVSKTVGLDRIDSNCIYYWTANSAFPSFHQPIWASVLWMGGEYPTESQWRAEGHLTRVTPEECVLRGFVAPPSLIAHVTACHGCDCDNEHQRPSRPENYDDLVHEARQNNPNSTSSVCMIRFVPIRIEVLQGGPSTRLSGLPRRWEWRRDLSTWGMRSILPFSKTISSFQRRTFRNMTIAIVGTHGSGKATIGNALAKLLDCKFDPELGEILRDNGALVASGHLHGNGSCTTTNHSEQQNWDDKIHEEECQRDNNANTGSRVVETWHLGNYAWCQLRQKQNQHGQKAEANLERYKCAIAKHNETHLVLLVKLNLASSSIIVQRRKEDATMRERLPMQDEEKECQDLHQLLQRDNDDSLEDLVGSLDIPCLRIDNGRDGKEAMNEVLLEILSFVEQNCHRASY